jgi:hypothetical protein
MGGGRHHSDTTGSPASRVDSLLLPELFDEKVARSARRELARQQRLLRACGPDQPFFFTTIREISDGREKKGAEYV